MFYQDWQKLLKPLFDLTRKGREFPVFHVSDNRGIFHPYSDKSSLPLVSYQAQNGLPKLIIYASKKIPLAVKLFSNWAWSVWLCYQHCRLLISVKRVGFDAVMDHLTLTHIMKTKMEPETKRIEVPVEVLNTYSLNLYYLKGIDMVLSEFLLRMKGDESNPHAVIAISLNIHYILTRWYYTIANDTAKSYTLPAKTAVFQMSNQHGVDKAVNPNAGKNVRNALSSSWATCAITNHIPGEVNTGT